MAARPLSLALVLLLTAGCADDGADGDGDGDAALVEAGRQTFDLEFMDSGTVLGTVGTGTPPAPNCNGVDRDGVNVVRHAWDLPAQINGTEVEVTGAVVTLTLRSQTLLDADLYVESPSGQVLGSAVDFNPMTGPSESVTLGELPAGTYQIIVRGCSGNGAYDVTATASAQSVKPAEGATSSVSVTSAGAA